MKTRTWGPGWGLVAWWFLGASVVLLLQSWLFEVNFLIALASLPFLLVLSIVLLVMLLARRAWDAALVFVAATVLMPFLPLNPLGYQAWTRISFMQHRDAYEKIVARAPGLPDHGSFAGETYRKDGPRIAFPRSEGMPDGWGAVVHDPANAMLLTDHSNQSAFGSQIQSCIRIERNWFRCWFD